MTVRRGEICPLTGWRGRGEGCARGKGKDALRADFSPEMGTYGVGCICGCRRVLQSSCYRVSVRQTCLYG